jgi:hypothetical protein
MIEGQKKKALTATGAKGTCIVAASARPALDRQRGTRVVIPSSRRQLLGQPEHSPARASSLDTLLSARDQSRVDRVAL